MVITVGAVLILATQAVTLLTAVAGLWLTMHNKREIKNVGEQVNGRMTELLAVNKLVDTAAGKAQEVADQSARADAEARRQGGGNRGGGNGP